MTSFRIVLRTFGLACCACFVVHGAAVSQETTQVARDTDGERAAELQLILDDPLSTLAERRSAEEELIAIGPRVLEWLQPVETAAGAESLRRVRREVERLHARDVVRASTVTLERGETISEALRLIEEQTGNRFDGIAGIQTASDIAVQQAEYWPTFDRLLDEANLEPARFLSNDSRPLLIERGEDVADRFGAAAYQDAFRIETTRVDSRLDLRDSVRSRLSLTIEIAWEPRLRLIDMSIPFESIRMVDDQQRMIAPNEFARQVTARIQPGQPRTDVTLPFELPMADATSIAELRGIAQCVVLGRDETFTMDLDVARSARDESPITQRHGDCEVKLASVTLDAERHAIELSVRFDDASDSLESHHDWIFRNRAYVLDREGRVWEPTQRVTTDQSTHQVDSVYYFEPALDLDGAQFIYRTPTAVIDHELEFTLIDIRLP